MNRRDKRRAKQAARAKAEREKTCVRCKETFDPGNDKHRKLCFRCKDEDILKAEKRAYYEKDPEERHWENMATFNERFSSHGEDW